MNDTQSIEELVESLMQHAVCEISQDSDGVVHFFNYYGDELFTLNIAKGDD